MELIEVGFPQEMSDSKFILHLQKTGQIKWELFGCEGRFRVVDRNFLLYDGFPRGVWSLFSLPFNIGVKVLEKGLAREWPNLDWEALEAEGKRLSDKFRDSPDW